MPGISLPPYAAAMLSRLHSLGYDAYVVGGCVRDRLLGREPADWDITTSALPHETTAAFANQPDFIVRTGNGLRHGTVTVARAENPHESCEITTFRTEGAYTDHRRPDDVTFVSDIRADLARRDFTINAMAATETERIDPFGGQDDLTRGRIRCVGDAEKRLDEDALRILRGLRFAARYGFSFEAATAKAMHALAPTLTMIAPERLGCELVGILSGTDCGRIVCAFPDIFALLLPGCTTAEALSSLPDVESRLALLCWRCSIDSIRQMLLHLALGARLADAVCTLVAHADSPLQTHRDLCLLLREIGADRLDSYFALRRAITPEDASLPQAEAAAQSILTNGECYSVATLAIGGRELSACGIATGREIGAQLTMLTDAVIDGRVENERAALLAFAKKHRT